MILPSFLTRVWTGLKQAGAFMVQRWKWGAGILGGLLVLAGVAFIALPAPSAHGALRGHTVQISRNADIRVVFDQRMDTSSVERAFKIVPSVGGSFRWEANMMIYKPNTSLEKGTTYKVDIGESARNWFFKSLKPAYQQSFEVLDYPEVAVVAPVNDSEIRQTQTLTVLFDRPMRTLTGSLDVPNILQMTPDVKGKYHWLGTSGFEFIPENGWPAATDFSVTIPKGTKMADGGSLVEDYTWKFSTPRLRASMYTETMHVNPNVALRLSFNYPMKPEALRAALVMQEASSTVAGDRLMITVDPQDPLTLIVAKKDALRLGTSYQLSLPQGFTGNVGPKGLEYPWNVYFTTDANTFEITAACPATDGTKDVSDSVVFMLNNPVDVNGLESHLHISPKLENMGVNTYAWSSDPRCQGASDGRGLTISGSWKPSTKYTISIDGKLTDIYKQPLKNPQNVAVTTKPYQPSATLQGYSMYGLIASHMPHVYQMRTLNLTGSVETKACSGTFQQYKGSADFDCALKGEKVYDAKAALNTYKIIDMNLDEIFGTSLPNGFYRLSVKVPELPDEKTRNFQDRIFVVADTAVTMKRDNGGKVMVWATNMKTGAVAPNLTVEMYRGMVGGNSLLDLLGSGKTDAQGIAQLELPKDFGTDGLSIRVFDATHLGIVSSGWDDGISIWNYGLNGGLNGYLTHHIGYIYSDRLIYRPDQRVQFRGVIRKDLDAALGIPDAKDVTVMIADPDGTEVSKQVLPFSSFGTFNGALQLEPSMKLGTYTVSVNMGDREGSTITGTFDVREYRRPDFKVDVQVPKNVLTSGQNANVVIHAEYYHGVALSNAKATYQITRNALYFQPQNTEWYNFGNNDNFDCYWYCRSNGDFENVVSGDVVLDQNGNATVSVPVNLTDYKTSANYFVTVTVTDLNQRQVSMNTDFPVHKGSFYMGIRGDYSRGWDATEADFNVISVNSDGIIRPSVPATVKLYRRVWSNSQKVGTDGTTSWEWQKTDTLIETKAITTDVMGKVDISFAPGQDGDYVAIVEAKDEKGNLISASAERYVYHWAGNVPVQVSDDHQMKITQSKAEYAPGETAVLAVQSPYENVKALVTVERDTVREHFVVTLDAAHRTVSVPIKEDSAPNVYVSVLVIKGGGEKGAPEFRLGYAELQVSTNKKKLNVSVVPNKTTYKPGDQVSVEIVTTKSDGSGVSAEVSLAVVDERVVALLGSVDKNILGRFWFRRWIGVSTSQSLTQLVKKVYVATEGGSGGKGDDGQPKAVRGNFLDTAYWKADVVTDAQGKARVTFALPDNLTSWQLMAIGATKDTVVGSAEARITTRKDVMVEPLLPRILRFEDTATLGATVYNTTDAKMTLDVSIAAEGLQIDGATTRSISLDAKGRTAVNWTVHVPMDAKASKITIRASGGGYQDGFEMTVPVFGYSVPEIVSASGMLQRNVTETLETPEDILTNVGDVRVAVSPNVGNGLSSGVDYLLNYEYGCSEQTTSAIVSSLVYDQLVTTKITKGSTEMVARAKAKVTNGLQRLVSMQRPDGGWGLWPEGSDSYGHTTAYVYWGLSQAQKAGYHVDDAVLDRAEGYLRGRLESWANDTTDSYQWLMSQNEKAEVLFAMSERKVSGLDGYASSLYEQRSSLAPFAKVHLAMALHNIQPNISSNRIPVLMADVKNRVTYLDPARAYVDEDRGYDWFMSSNIRTSAIYLMAMLRMDPQNRDIEPMVRYLMQEKKDGYWYSTQNTAMSLLALVEYAKANPIDTSPTSVTVFLNNAVLDQLVLKEGDVSGEISRSISMADYLKKGKNNQFGLEKDSDKKYFYDISMRVYRQITNVQPFENGFTVLSDYYAVDDVKNEHPLTQVKQGDTVRVHMKLLVPKMHSYVALENHLPAGLEAIDFSLKTSPQNIAGQEQQCAPSWGGEQFCMNSNSYEYGWWWENAWKHIEQRDDRVFLFSEKLQPGIYDYDFLAQAITPGEFRIPPARAYEFYNPLANGHNEGKVLKVMAK